MEWLSRNLVGSKRTSIATEEEQPNRALKDCKPVSKLAIQRILLDTIAFFSPELISL